MKAKAKDKSRQEERLELKYCGTVRRVVALRPVGGGQIYCRELRARDGSTATAFERAGDCPVAARTAMGSGFRRLRGLRRKMRERIQVCREVWRERLCGSDWSRSGCSCPGRCDHFRLIASTRG